MRFWLLLGWLFCAIVSRPFLSDRWETAQHRRAVHDLPRVTLSDLTGRADAPLRLAIRDGRDGWFLLPSEAVTQDLSIGMGRRPARDGWFAGEAAHVPHPCANRDGKLVLAAFPEGTRVLGFCDEYSVDLAPLRALASRAYLERRDVPLTEWRAVRADLAAQGDPWVLNGDPDLTRPFVRSINLPWVWRPDAGDEPAATIAALIAARLGDAASEADVARKDVQARPMTFAGGGPGSGWAIAVLEGTTVVPSDLVQPRRTSFTITCARAETCNRLAGIDPSAIAAPFRAEDLLARALERGETPSARPSFVPTPAIDFVLRSDSGVNRPTQTRTEEMVWIPQPGLSR